MGESKKSGQSRGIFLVMENWYFFAVVVNVLICSLGGELLLYKFCSYAKSLVCFLCFEVNNYICLVKFGNC